MTTVRAALAIPLISVAIAICLVGDVQATPGSAGTTGSGSTTGKAASHGAAASPAPRRSILERVEVDGKLVREKRKWFDAATGYRLPAPDKIMGLGRGKRATLRKIVLLTPAGRERGSARPGTTITESVIAEARYTTQYLMHMSAILIDENNTARTLMNGWIDRGTPVTIPAVLDASPTVDGTRFERLDNTAAQKLVVRAPQSIDINYETFVRVTADSDVADIFGSGWHRVDTTVRWRVKSIRPTRLPGVPGALGARAVPAATRGAQRIGNEPTSLRIPVRQDMQRPALVLGAMALVFLLFGRGSWHSTMSVWAGIDPTAKLMQHGTKSSAEVLL